MATTITNTSITADSITGSTSVTSPTVNTNTIDPTQGYLSIAEQNSSGEGGEIQLAGSNSNPNVVIDNYNGQVRILQGANTRLSIDSDGRMNTPVQPHVRGTFASSGGSVAADTVVNMNPPIEARGGITYNSTNQRLTVAKAGRYLVYGQLLCAPSGSYTYFGFKHNGNLIHHAHLNIFGGTNVNNGDHITTSILTLSANDYIDFHILYQPLSNYYGGAHSQYYMYMLG